MLSKQQRKEIRDAYNMDTLTKLQLFDITEELIIDIIEKDNGAFSNKNLAEWSLKKKFPDEKRLGEILKIVLQLADKKYIIHSGIESRVTLRGKLYREYSRKGIGLWTLIIGIVLALAGIGVTIWIFIYQERSAQSLPKEQPQNKLEQVQPKTSDSPSFQEKRIDTPKKTAFVDSGKKA